MMSSAPSPPAVGRRDAFGIGLRHEAAIDDHDAAVGRAAPAQTPNSPGPGSSGRERRAAGVDQRLPVVHEVAREGSRAEIRACAGSRLGQRSRAGRATGGAASRWSSVGDQRLPSRPCARAARCRARSGRDESAAGASRLGHQPAARAPLRCTRAHGRVARRQAAFRGLVVILQRDHQPFHRPQRPKRRRSGSAAATAPHAPRRAADRRTSVTSAAPTTMKPARNMTKTAGPSPESAKP